MYSIGTFSQMNHVSVKTLRHYDAIGLLKPRYVDTRTMYRYYDASQMTELYHILTLKQLGFSLDEIREVQAQRASLAQVLAQKQQQVQCTLQLETAKLSRIRTTLEAIEKGWDQMQDVVIKALPEVTIASVRRVMKNYEELNYLMPEVLGRLMQEAGCVCAAPDYCFNTYYDCEYRERDVDVEVCQAVTKLQPDHGELHFQKLEHVPQAACLLHHGSYDTLPKSYAAINAWIAQNGYKVVGMPRESYIDGVWNKERPEDWLTELQFPIAKA
nr:MerR family transcriptional regulator [Maliibacterium massiliense]